MFQFIIFINLIRLSSLIFTTYQYTATLVGLLVMRNLNSVFIMRNLNSVFIKVAAQKYASLGNVTCYYLF